MTVILASDQPQRAPPGEPSARATGIGAVPLGPLRYQPSPDLTATKAGSPHDAQASRTPTAIDVIYRAIHDDYQDSILPDGQRAGSAEDALDCACGLYLNDPTAWTPNPSPTN